jgi:hypothetical protein
MFHINTGVALVAVVIDAILLNESYIQIPLPQSI